MLRFNNQTYEISFNSPFASIRDLQHLQHHFRPFQHPSHPNFQNMPGQSCLVAPMAKESMTLAPPPIYSQKKTQGLETVKNRTVLFGPNVPAAITPEPKPITPAVAPSTFLRRQVT